MVDLSKILKNAVINLYKDGTYTVDYAIIEASKLADKNKINAIFSRRTRKSNARKYCRR